MQKLVSSLLAFLLPATVWAQIHTASNHIWEAAAFGEIPGITLVSIYGINPAPTTTFEVQWGESANYVPKITSISSPICESSSANDAAAGTGARTISVTGLDTSFARFTETVTLNGTTAVAMATANVMFIDKITVLTAGSTLANAGIVQCGDTDAGAGDLTNPAQYLPVSSPTAVTAAGVGGGNVSQSFMYGVAAGKTLVCRNVTAGYYLVTTANGIQAEIDGFTNSTGVLKRYFNSAGNNLGSTSVTLPNLVVFPEKTLILGKMAVTAVGPTFMSAECLLIDNTWEDSSQTIF